MFLPSFSEHERAFLLKYAKVLVYTPSNEVCQKHPQVGWELELG